jgi:hypothetical protein
MRTISSARNQTSQNPKKKRQKLIRKYLDKFNYYQFLIRSKCMDAYRNAKSIGQLMQRMGKVEQKMKKDNAISAEIESKYFTSINNRLYWLIGLWILDKLILLTFFLLFNA